MAKESMLGYIERDTFVHRLTGLTKLLVFLMWSIVAMISFDTRVLVVLLIVSILLFRASKIKFAEVSFVFVFIFVMMLLNTLFIYLFSPEEGVKIYQSRTVLFHIAGRYDVTMEQLFYQVTILIKYFVIVPIALLFILTTQPNEFAASLNAIFVPYSIAYAVAIALRYIPDVQRDYRNISFAQQARGIELSKKAGVFKRLKGTAIIILPLVFTSIERINSIANAMELRGFGKHKKRTWYAARPFASRDKLAVVLVSLLMIASLWVTASNGSRFYNPFR